MKVPQHIRNDEEAHMTAANVDLVEMRDAPVACRDRDILQLDVHVILGWDALAGVWAKTGGNGRVADEPSRSFPR